MKPVVVVEYRPGDAADLPELVRRVEELLRVARDTPDTRLRMPGRIVAAREE